MIFRRALTHELLTTTLVVFCALLGITATTLIVRYLGQAATGIVGTDAVIAFLGFSLVNYLPVLLSLTVFVAVVLTLTRSYRDNEMIVWFTSGLGLYAWIRPILYFMLPITAAVAVISLLLSPWALQKSAEYKRQIESRSELTAIAPGVFQESKNADRVYFVESFSPERNTVRNIFIQSEEHGKLGVMVAQFGYQTIAKNQDRYLVLLNGRRYEGNPGAADYRITEFERYVVRVTPYEAKLGVPTAKSLSTAALLKNKSLANIAELQWRLGLPLSTIILALLAIPLGFSAPRAGRYVNLVMGLLIFMTYSNLLSVAQAWVVQGKIYPAVGLWGVHLMMIILLIALFYRRLAVNGSLRLR